MRVETVQRTLFKFEELDDDAKEVARAWLRDIVLSDPADDFEDAATIGRLLGIEFDQQIHRTLGGGTVSSPKIYYSGFSSQGDGASFDGSYRYAKNARKAIRKYAPQDTTLHQLADDLFDVQRKNFYRLEARTKHRGYYYHSGCMSVEVTARAGNDVGIGPAEDVITNAMRGFADWIYSQLEKEHEYRMSDDAIDDTISVNEYEFDQSGERA